MRLQKYLAQCGVASRRKAKELIEAGHVSIDGVPILLPSYPVEDESVQICVDGKTITQDVKTYIILNKPKDCISSCNDHHAERTIMDLIPTDKRLYPVGRLDKDTEGLLILTNDGDLTFALTHPSHEFVKTYEAMVKGIPDDAALMALEEGVLIDDDGKDYRTAPAKVERLKKFRSSARLKIQIHEGKKRQVRKMCEAVGHPVIALKRTQVGKLDLAGLKVGEWRYLRNDEVRYLKGEE